MIGIISVLRTSNQKKMRKHDETTKPENTGTVFGHAGVSGGKFKIKSANKSEAVYFYRDWTFSAEIQVNTRRGG